jgi:hypothetical protein
MLQLKNPTGLAATMFLSPDPDGVDTLYAVVKGTFALSPEAQPWAEPALAVEQAPVTLAPEHWADPATSSIKSASDICLLKPATDVLLVGHAHAPQGRPTTWMDVVVGVGPVRKMVRVFGDRVWVQGPGGWAPSTPSPFTRMPLVWERAFGGRATGIDGVPHEEPRNPVGAGFRPSSVGPTDGMPLPNLENPERPVTSWALGPAPACFAPICAHWEPRRGCAGTYGAQWQRRRAPYLPTDFDPRFFQLAPPDLIAPGYLQGGEPVELHGVSPRGPIRAVLPRVRVDLAFDMDSATYPRQGALDTVLLEPDAGRMVLVWRAALPCDKQALKVSAVRVAAYHVAVDPARGGTPHHVPILAAPSPARSA